MLPWKLAEIIFLFINLFFIWFQWMFILCQEMKMCIMYLKNLLNTKNLDWQVLEIEIHE